MTRRFSFLALWAVCVAGPALADEILKPINERFANENVEETPSFQRHVVTLFGRLGCNGRACHGSFQGRGGFKLSLFGFDFDADHTSLLDKKQPRVNVEQPLESLILTKPVDEDLHEGGKRFEKGSWQYHVFRKWIEGGAKHDSNAVEKLVRLDVTPAEIQFKAKGETVTLRAVAVWENGQREDVTTLCRFQSNNEQIATISKDGLVTAVDPGDSHVVAFYDNAVVPVPVLRPVSQLTGKNFPKVKTPTKIDELVVQKLKKLGIVPSDVAGDTEFLRRLKLDLTGTLPTTQEIEAFVSDNSPDKRAKKIDELLDSTAYAAWWTTRLCDWTGNNDFQLQQVLQNLGRGSPTQDWYDWIYKRVSENTPYDKLAEGIITAVSRKPGQTYTQYCEEMSAVYRSGSETKFADRGSMPHYWSRRDFRMAEPRAINFAYAFMGVRIQCAQCHKHPFDQWSKKDFEQFLNFFTQVDSTQQQRARREDQKEYDEIVKALGIEMKGGNQQQIRQGFGKALSEGKTIPFSEVYVGRMQQNRGGRPGGSKVAKLLGGDVVDLAQTEDARVSLMNWLRDKNNPYFARAFVNRVWANYFNVGIIQPPDDINLANPPSNAALLDYLAAGFVEHNYDMKWVHREITNSQTYQRTWKPTESNRADEKNFSHSIPRRLPAEVAYDALRQAAAADEAADKMQTDMNGRAIAIAGASSRNVGGRGGGQSFALQVFGRSTRESNCDCDRSEEANLLQTVFLQNDQEVLSNLDQRGSWVDQVRRETTKAPKKGDDLDDRIASLKARLKKLEQKGNKDDAKQVEAELEALTKKTEEPAEKPAADESVPKFVRQAYLRTLSRTPTTVEQERAVKFVQESATTPDGLRGLMWALLNTKEFIVNH